MKEQKEGSNVIYVDFVARKRIEPAEDLYKKALQTEKPQISGKRKPMARMNKGEAHSISMRITEIEQALAACDDRFDADVIENLNKELDQLYQRLSG